MTRQRVILFFYLFRSTIHCFFVASPYHSLLSPASSLFAAASTLTSLCGSEPFSRNCGTPSSRRSCAVTSTDPLRHVTAIPPPLLPRECTVSAQLWYTLVTPVLLHCLHSLSTARHRHSTSSPSARVYRFRAIAVHPRRAGLAPLPPQSLLAVPPPSLSAGVMCGR